MSRMHVVVVILICFACAISPHAFGGELVKVADHHYTFAVPDGWLEWANSPMPFTGNDFVFRQKNTDVMPILSVRTENNLISVADPDGFSYGLKSGAAKSNSAPDIKLLKNETEIDARRHRIIAVF